MKELPHKAAQLRLSVARRVYRLSGCSSFKPASAPPSSPEGLRYRSGRILLVVTVIFAMFIASSMVDGMQTDLPRTIAKGDQSQIESATQVLARTEAEWAALWRRHAGDGDRPRVDFTREMVVGVFMGSRPNAGFSTTIVTSMEVKRVLIVRYRETIPSRDAITAQILTFPYHLVAIAKATVNDVKFEKAP
jgi:hypothetical protein